MTRKALIIEDDPDIANLVQIHLKDIDCDSDIAPDGKTGIEMFERQDYAIVILDLMLPEKDGLQVCREIRELPGYTPVLMLTAKSSELDRVMGLETGADDYLTKPFSIPELQARIKALFRRVDALKQVNTESADQNKLITCGDLRIDLQRHQVLLAGDTIELTAREFDLLVHFALHPGRVYSRVQLLDKVWGYNHEGYEHTVNTHINRLRNKIEKDPANPDFILTVWGVGYKFTESC